MFVLFACFQIRVFPIYFWNYTGINKWKASDKTKQLSWNSVYRPPFFVYIFFWRIILVHYLTFFFPFESSKRGKRFYLKLKRRQTSLKSGIKGKAFSCQCRLGRLLTFAEASVIRPVRSKGKVLLVGVTCCEMSIMVAVTEVKSKWIYN